MYGGEIKVGREYAYSQKGDERNAAFNVLGQPCGTSSVCSA